MASNKPAHTPISFIKHCLSLALHRYRTLHIYGKIFIWLVVLFYICLAAIILILTPSRIAQFLYDHARKLAETEFGWLALLGGLIFISFPPLVGHTTLVSLSGFAYGMKGFLIAASGSVIGSAAAFILLRYIFHERLRRWSSQNEKWQALEEVVRAKGLPLIILIRVSPFPPWVYSNSLFASIQPVKFWQFVVATFFIFPKLLLHVFIGSRMAALSDGKQREGMDTHTKILNASLIVGGILIAVFASWLVYTLVQNHIRHLKGFPSDIDELAAEAIEDYDEEAPLLGSPSPASQGNL
ncbi:hypothetical protein AMATHDRAFT_74980 [Amanita thiersii Skay4041]|uniref:Golgi apparatus membrane protein TVP38 n=1 Tax=Amanita thiersii Skay4041 TaxID=703135 RepID=A0A2A9NUP4_9AGAR|nr:hypothetical protein AMATHDRAFT_74980 [Amanita thiersii Skay4041]